MREYSSIKNIYKREPGTNRITNEFADPVFGNLLEAPWEVTEKLDGTNVRLILGQDNTYSVRGRTDKSQLPPALLEYCQGLESQVQRQFGGNGIDVCLYGEGVGKRIQKHGDRYGDTMHFRLFDVKIGRWWLARGEVQEVAEALGIPYVPFLGTMPLGMAISLWRDYPQAPKSMIFDGVPEGWVLRPAGGLLFRDGTPIRAKIKERDFQVLRDEGRVE